MGSPIFEGQARGTSLLSPQDIYLFKEGTHTRLYDKLGCHFTADAGVEGAHFAVWAPNAERVTVVGDFNDWDPGRHPLTPRSDDSGVWEGFVPHVQPGARYKYQIESRYNGYKVAKADPYGFYCEEAPDTASRAWRLDYEWHDQEWMSHRAERNALSAAHSTYEVHLGSWRRGDDNRVLSYREIAPQLAAYAVEMGFTHVELMPVCEHPFYGSWGYQITGYFAPTSRYGTPQDFMFLIETLHRHGIAVIMDWVPSHFPGDEHGLVYFDGTHLYEHADPRKGLHPEWNSYIFNYGRNEVRAFLISNAMYWLDKYHVDGLRVDAVASMLYLDYARRSGEWIPNRHGGRENLEAIQFLRQFNEAVYRDYPDTQTIAEESTAWPMVSRPVYVGGLGFGMKWNMGWMHDTLDYFSKDPMYRKYHHNRLTFSIWYAFTENFVLPLSHDEVVHGKASLIGKMPGDDWQKFANLRAMLGYMWTHPGKKLLFMGGEFAQRREWQHDFSLDWHLLGYDSHRGVKDWLGDLNACYRREPALHECDFDGAGFEWVDAADADNSVVVYLRRPRNGSDVILIACNFTPVPRQNYLLGVPHAGHWHEVLNSDAPRYGGSGMGNFGGADSAPIAAHGRFQSINITLPPLAVVIFKSEGQG
jgi:1,4-alpha-glucan branching enzyme